MGISADPKITVKQDTEGGERVRASLSETERIQARLADAIKRANFEASYREAAKASTEFQAAQDRLATASGRLTSAQQREADAIEAATRAQAESNRVAAAGAAGQRGFASRLADTYGGALKAAGGMATMANQTAELANKLAGAYQAVYEFGKAGAEAAGVSEKFGAFEARIENIKTAMQSATASALVNSGALDKVAMVLELVGGAVATLIALADKFYVFEIMYGGLMMLIGPGLLLVEGLEAIGEAVGLLDDDTVDLTETINEFDRAIHNVRPSVKGLADEVKDMFGGGASTREIEATGRVLLMLGERGEVSRGALAQLTGALYDAAGSSEDYRKAVEELSGWLEKQKNVSQEAKRAVLELAEAEVKRAAITKTVLEWQKGAAGSLEDLVSGASKLVNESGIIEWYEKWEQGSAKAGRSAQKQAAAVLDLAAAWAVVRGSFAAVSEERQWAASAARRLQIEKSLQKSVADVVDASIKHRIKGQKEAIEAALFYADKAQGIADEAVKQEASNDKTRADLALNTARSYGLAAAEYLGGGWARAGFEAAFELGMGFANLSTPPLFGADHFAAVPLLLAAQAFASSNGGKTGSSSGSAGRAAAAPAGNAMLKRPDSRSNGGSGPAVTQLWLRNRIVGETVIQDVADVARRGGRQIPAAAVGGGNRRGF